mmetsp:Transcript_61353/g.126697  ORF Transcript_61353/g.126697 Transcript_61353/m.126697 type:complete len:246 (+) Transcript_61353:217-954(+)
MRNTNRNRGSRANLLLRRQRPGAVAVAGRERELLLSRSLWLLHILGRRQLQRPSSTLKTFPSFFSSKPNRFHKCCVSNLHWTPEGYNMLIVEGHLSACRAFRSSNLSWWWLFRCPAPVLGVLNLFGTHSNVESDFVQVFWVQKERYPGKNEDDKLCDDNQVRHSVLLNLPRMRFQLLDSKHQAIKESGSLGSQRYCLQVVQCRRSVWSCGQKDEQEENRCEQPCCSLLRRSRVDEDKERTHDKLS